MQKIAVIMCFAFVLSGCATIGTASLDRMSDSKMYKKIGMAYVAIADKEAMRKEFVDRYPEWPQDVKNAILQGEIIIGMTEGQVLASWGSPESVNRTIFKNHTREQWIYSQWPHFGYLYFDNGILTAQQD